MYVQIRKFSGETNILPLNVVKINKNLQKCKVLAIYKWIFKWNHVFCIDIFGEMYLHVIVIVYLTPLLS